MNKQPLLAVVAAALMVCGSAQAEFLIGGQAGFVESEGNYRIDGVDALSDEESGSAFGMFGQYRFKANDGVTFGVHLGWGDDATEWQDGLVNAGYIVLSTGESVYVDSFAFTFETSNAIDLLGLIAFPGERIRPLAMFGYSSIEVERIFQGTVTDSSGFTQKLTQTDSATLSGWKLAAGAEFPFGENWLGHVLLHHTDYGDKDIGPIGESVEVVQTGIRFGMAYSF